MKTNQPDDGCRKIRMNMGFCNNMKKWVDHFDPPVRVGHYDQSLREHPDLPDMI